MGSTPDYRANKAESRQLLAAQIDRLQAESRNSLLRLVRQRSHEVGMRRSGVPAIVETQVFFDDRAGGDLRVVADVWRPDAPNPPLAADDFTLG